MAAADDLNVFMVCRALVEDQLTALPDGYSLRSLRPDEIAVWRAFPFDTEAEARAYESFMSDFFDSVYRDRSEDFFESTKVICGVDDRPVGTCGIWRAYERLTTLQWLKVRREDEGRGVGRALVSAVLRELGPETFPVYLHTQAGSHRAIKLYTDLGFDIIEGELPGPRPNEAEDAMAQLASVMPTEAFTALRTTIAPPELLAVLAEHDTIEF